VLTKVTAHLLQVLVTKYSPGRDVSILGLFTVQDKYAYWVWLLLCAVEASLLAMQN
jgi:hypothetical protein